MPLVNIPLRFDWTNAEGVPKKPDWSELRVLRERQRLEAVQQSNKKARIVSFAPDTDLPDHDCGELFAFFKERAKERCEMN